MLNHWTLFYYFTAFVIGVFSIGLSAVFLLKARATLLWAYLGMYLPFSFITITDIFSSYVETNVIGHDLTGLIVLFLVNLAMIYLFMFTLAVFSHELFDLPARRRRNIIAGMIALSGYVGLHGLTWYGGQSVPPDSLSLFFLELPLAGMTVYCLLLSVQHYRQANTPKQKRAAGKILALFSGFTLIVLEDSIIGGFPGLLIYPVAYAGIGLFFSWYFIDLYWVHPSHIAPLFNDSNVPEFSPMSPIEPLETERSIPDAITTDSTLDTLCEQYQISPREKDVLALLLQGCTNVQIAERLFISANTAKTHISNIYEKVGVKRRYELLARFQSASSQPPISTPEDGTHPNG